MDSGQSHEDGKTSKESTSASSSGPHGLVFYVTSHGFGHLNRTVAVINQVPREIPLAIRCGRDLFVHWRERLERPADLGEYVSDSGACHPPGDSGATDGPATLEQARAIHDRAYQQLDREAEWLRERQPAAIVSDAPPLPLVAAERAGVPSFVLANFDWRDIYLPHARRISTAAVEFARKLGGYYRKANALLRAQPSMAMRDYRRRIDLGLVVNLGRDRREELRATFGLSSRERLVYIYRGRYDQDSLVWDRMANLEKQGIHLIGFHKPTEIDLPNLHVVDPKQWSGADLALSTNAMLAKAGYGTVSEAMAARTPLIYPPRPGFAEHRALDQALKAWGGGIVIPVDDFQSFRVERHLDQAFQSRPRPSIYPLDGANRAARFLADHCRAFSRDANWG